MTSNSASRNKSWTRKPAVWCFSTYFTEGFPFIIIRTVSAAFFRDRNVSLQAIGLTSLYGLPWILKFLWGPHVDEFGTKRTWLLGTQGILSVVLLLAAFCAPLEWGIQAIALVFFLGSIIAATSDIAIDGYYMEALDKDGQAKYVGYRVMAYRIAMMIGTGIIASIGLSPKVPMSWLVAFVLAAILYGGFFVYHIFFLPKVETEKKPISQVWKSILKLRFLAGVLLLGLGVFGLRSLYNSQFHENLRQTYPILKKIYFSGWIGIALFVALFVLLALRKKLWGLITRNPDSFYSRAFISFMDRKKIGIVIGFVIFLRTGEFMLTSMVSPFIIDLGIKQYYGVLSAGVGLPCSIVGALVGGAMISRFTLKKVLWPFLLAQNFTNVVYMILAFSLSYWIQTNTGAENPLFMGWGNFGWVALVHAFDQFAGGLGTAVLMTYLMRICLPQFKAAHYAIGTGLMSVSGVFAGVAGGLIADLFGYGYFFGISFLVSIPGMILVFFLPRYDD